MTDEELAKAYYRAALHAQALGTGLIKLSIRDGELVVDVIEPAEAYEIMKDKDE